MKSIFTTLLLYIFALSYANAQARKFQIQDFETSPNSYYFQGVNLSPEEFIQAYVISKQLDANYAFKMRTIDSTGVGKIMRYQAYYKGYEILGNEIVLTVMDNSVSVAGTYVMPNLNIMESRLLSEADALKAALDFYKAKKYAWEDEAYERDMKILGDKNGTYYPRAKLKVYSNPNEKVTPLLTYAFTIVALEPAINETIYINANNGSIVKAVSNIHNCTPEYGCGTTGTVATLYNGNQNLKTRWYGGFRQNYDLLDCRTSGATVPLFSDVCGIETKNNESFDRVWNDTPIITDVDNSWSVSTASSGHWATQKSWDYYQYTFGRNGCDNNKKPVRVTTGCRYKNVIVGYEQNGRPIYRRDEIRNAASSMEGQFLRLDLGFAPGSNRSYTCLDVMGHEFTHGVTSTTSQLVYQGKSGALDESFADIFGNMVQRFAKCGVTEWSHAEDTWQGRDFVNPNLSTTPQPSYYGQTPYWVSTSSNSDYGGVHTNSGVQNKWFYLLSQGGTVTIPAIGGGTQTISVQGIGIDNAVKITYQNMISLNANATFLEARDGAINAAKLLFGQCSNQSRQTAKAWAAVGVGSSIDNQLCLDFVPTMNSIINYQYDDPIPNTVRTYTATVFPSNATVNFTKSSVWSSTTSGNNVTITTNRKGGNVTATASLAGQTSISQSRSITYREIGGPCPGCPVRLRPNYTQKPLLYPNPANDNIFINMRKDFTTAKVDVYDILGRKVFNKQLLTQESFNDISELSAGWYIFQITVDDEQFVERIKVD